MAPFGLEKNFLLFAAAQSCLKVIAAEIERTGGAGRSLLIKVLPRKVSSNSRTQVHTAARSAAGGADLRDEKADDTT